MKQTIKQIVNHRYPQYPGMRLPFENPKNFNEWCEEILQEAEVLQEVYTLVSNIELNCPNSVICSEKPNSKGTWYRKDCGECNVCKLKEIISSQRIS